jgi:hypothetical protein
VIEYYNQTAIWYPRTGHSGKTPTYGAGVEIRCRWEKITRRVKDEQGEVTTIHGATVTTSAAINKGDRLEYQGQDWIVPEVDEIPDVNGEIRQREVVF